ncbi:YqaE/Pmp3 family membrane protein [Dongia sedimenti]|uniref:YqaE/Pmp3 family membrane protein n=1 Tax=Dongia sedimenti TaxID=3064282 RepID=A0ABU0YRR6_9PROT|nr:YqaE/Pmp3 family membrane protein [Rhodospirillaceae bacterium R-7]
MNRIFTLSLPFVSFVAIGRLGAGLFCLFLQLTLIGWIPAAIWASFVVSRHHTESKIAGAFARAQRSNRYPAAVFDF